MAGKAADEDRASPGPGHLEHLEPQERKRVVERYNKRLSFLRKARECSHDNETKRAVDHYFQYLGSLAHWHRTEEEKLSPDHFDKAQDLAELLLISHVYWDLAKAYDRSPSLSSEVVRCLDQFCRFTVGFKYQYANAQVAKKFIQRPVVRNKKAFQDACERVSVSARGCYVATWSLGGGHPATEALRRFRDGPLARRPAGRALARLYGRWSPRLVRLLVAMGPAGRALDVLVARPLLLAAAGLLRALGRAP